MNQMVQKSDNNGLMQNPYTSSQNSFSQQYSSNYQPNIQKVRNPFEDDDS